MIQSTSLSNAHGLQVEEGLHDDLAVAVICVGPLLHAITVFRMYH